MNIGKMKYRITLIESVYGDDGVGGRPKIDERKHEVWADVRASSFSRSKQTKAYDAPVALDGRTIYIRKNAGKGISRGWKAQVGNNLYEIKSVDDLQPEYLILSVMRVEIGV